MSAHDVAVREYSAPELFVDGEPGAPTRLPASACTECRRVEFPYRAECPACRGVMTRIDLEGPARARTVTAVLAQAPGALRQAPYGVCVAEFNEGICVIGLTEGPVGTGDRVEPVVVEAYAGRTTFGFRRLTG